MTAVPDQAADPAAATGRPLRKDAARNRQLLVDAARELFAQRGLDTTLDDVARHAGVGVATAYRHFANRHELADAIMLEVTDQVAAELDKACRADDPWQGIVGFLDTVLRMQSADRGLREVFAGLESGRGKDQMYDRLTAPFGELLARARAAGALRADARSSDLAMVITMLGSVVDLSAEHAPELWRRYLPIILAGLRPGGPDLPVPAMTDEQFRSASVRHPC